MSKYSVAIVLLGLMAGAAVGIVYENARQGGAVVQGVAEATADAAHEATDGEVALSSRAEELRPEGGGENEVIAGAPAASGVRRASRAKNRADTPARANSRPVVAARSHVRVQRREAGGGRGVAGHMVGGFKKTGAVVSKPFVKVGSLFHD